MKIRFKSARSLRRPAVAALAAAIFVLPSLASGQETAGRTSAADTPRLAALPAPAAQAAGAPADLFEAKELFLGWVEFESAPHVHAGNRISTRDSLAELGEALTVYSD